MKKFFIALLVLFSSCAVPQYIYVVDDLYYSQPQRRPNNMPRHFNRRYSINPPLPFQYPYWHLYQAPNIRKTPGRVLQPRKENLDAYNPQIQLPPPPPPSTKNVEASEERKKEAPIRKFF